MSASGMMPPPNTTMSAASRSREQLDDPGEQRHVRAGQHRQPDRVGVLLDGGLDDLLRRLVQAGVDDLHPGVAQRPGDDLGAAVVTVEAGLGDHDADGSRSRSRGRGSTAASADAGRRCPPDGAGDGYGSEPPWGPGRWPRRRSGSACSVHRAGRRRLAALRRGAASLLSPTRAAGRRARGRLGRRPRRAVPAGRGRGAGPATATHPPRPRRPVAGAARAAHRRRRGGRHADPAGARHGRQPLDLHAAARGRCAGAASAGSSRSTTARSPATCGWPPTGLVRPGSSSSASRPATSGSTSSATAWAGSSRATTCSASAATPGCTRWSRSARRTAAPGPPSWCRTAWPASSARAATWSRSWPSRRPAAAPGSSRSGATWTR